MSTETEDTPKGSTADVSSVAGRHWQAIVVERWYQLGKEVLGTNPDRSLRLREVVSECDLLTVVVAWFMNDGNITRTAESLRSNRRSVRDRVARWRERYPHLVPTALASKEPSAATRVEHSAPDHSPDSDTNLGGTP